MRWTIGFIFGIAGLSFAQPSPPSGDAQIRAQVGGAELVITTTSRLAGAIHSLTWNGREFIDSFDHGRQLQSACFFDCGKPQFYPECYNPTEAGSRFDGAGPRSSSQLLKIRAAGNELETTTRMAFWLRPGERSEGQLALNTENVSQHLISKKVRIGVKNLPHAIAYDVVFTVPPGEKHTLAQFEAVTGYMPADFSEFYAFNAATSQLERLSDGPGEQAKPVVLATKNGSHAMGVYSPQQPSPGFENIGYGRFRFITERVTKWNCVFRVRNPQGVPAGEYKFSNFVIVGTLDDVRKTLAALHAMPAK